MIETRRIHQFERERASRRAPAMPVDYTAYLLSSSPPGFEFYSLRDHLVTLGGTHGVQGVASRRQNAQVLKPFTINSDADYHVQNSDNVYVQGRTPPDPSSPTSPVSIPSPSSPTSPSCRLKKKVSFADDLGLALTAVRIMTEPSNTPPLLRSDILSSLTQGAKASVAITTPPLVLNFSQPASDYVSFRERLEKDCVSLENVILKEYNMVGTIKVKNIAFEKQVFVRITFDSWKSFKDISAKYVPSNSWGTGSLYDTFSFEASVPTNVSLREKIQFVVCFEANNNQYWDNNSSTNYEVISTQFKDAMQNRPNIVDEKPHDVTWSLYKNWSNLDDSVPYY